MTGVKRAAPDSADGKMDNAPKKAKVDDQTRANDAGGEAGMLFMTCYSNVDANMPSAGHANMTPKEAEKSWADFGVFFGGLGKHLTQKDEQMERLRKEKDDEISKLHASKEEIKDKLNAKIRALKTRAEKAEKELKETTDELNTLVSTANDVVTSDLEDLSDNVKRLEKPLRLGILMNDRSKIPKGELGR